MRYPATQTKAISYFSRQAIFWAELRSSHLPGCDWLAGLENTLNCRQYCRQICGSSNTISLLRIFGNPNKMLDWRTNPNLILLTNIRVCPSILYSNAGFNIHGCGCGVGVQNNQRKNKVGQSCVKLRTNFQLFC